VAAPAAAASLVGGNLFQRHGIFIRSARWSPRLRVPSLTQRATTARYFHDGSREPVGGVKTMGTRSLIGS